MYVVDKFIEKKSNLLKTVQNRNLQDISSI